MREIDEMKGKLNLLVEDKLKEGIDTVNQENHYLK